MNKTVKRIVGSALALAIVLGAGYTVNSQML